MIKKPKEYDKKLAYFYFNSKQYNKALSAFEKIIEEDPGNVSYRYLYASSFEKKKDYKRTIIELEKLLEIDQNHINSIRKIGFFYFQQTDILYNKEKKRYELMKNPTRVDYHNSIKKLEEISKGYTKALPYLEKSYDFKPNDKNIVACLNIVYKRLEMDKEIVVQP